MIGQQSEQLYSHFPVKSRAHCNDALANKTLRDDIVNMKSNINSIWSWIVVCAGGARTFPPSPAVGKFR